MVGMADVALFHPSFGVRPGVLDAAERLRRAGHQVLVVDQYDGLTFDDYDEADRYVEQLGFPELMRRALVAVQDLPDGFIVAGFSNGGGMAEYVATQRRCSGALLISGALPVAMLGATGWPRGLPAQIHYTVGDPRRRQEWLDQLVSEIDAAGAAVESSTTQGPATCSPTPVGPTSTTRQLPNCCGPALSPSAPHPRACLAERSSAGRPRSLERRRRTRGLRALLTSDSNRNNSEQ